MLRPLLLWASGSRRLQALAMDWSLARRVSNRFVAGKTITDVVAAIQKLNEAGIVASIDHLGENVDTVEGAKSAADACLMILDTINEYKLDANLSLKLTQLGLDVDENLCMESITKIAKRAAKYNNTIRIDMEGSGYTQRTLEVYYHLHKKHPNIGVVIQSYLYRSEKDVKKLVKLGGNVRLCKGAYKEPTEVAFPKKADVDSNFISLAEILFSETSLKKGTYPCIATHDEKIIKAIMAEVKKKKVPLKAFEFQMLYGIRPELQRSLASEGYRMRVYVPYGEQWYPYFVRRLAERPANIWFFVKNLFRK